MPLIPGNLAPDFTLNSVDEEVMVESFSLTDKKGKFVVLMLDLVFFGHVTPAEFHPLEPILEHFLSMDWDCCWLAISSTTKHIACHAPGSETGLNTMKIWMASDPTGEVAKMYGVYKEEENINSGALCIIDPEGKIVITMECDRKIMVNYALGKACACGDIGRVKELLIGGVGDVNNDEYMGRTPLMLAVGNKKTSIVSLLLLHPDLGLDNADGYGFTALHFACSGRSSPVTISLLGKDRRCTPVVLNKKDNGGDSPLMLTVMFGNLECLREMEKLDGTNFHTKNSSREGLVDVARRRIGENYGQEKCMAVLEYLLNRKKVESLKEMAAHSVASLLSSEDDVEKLDVPLVLHPWVAGFMDIVRNTENDDDSDGSDDESDGSDDESDESDEEEEEEEEEEMA